MSDSKEPTVQGINALLRRAGFDQAVITRNSRHCKQHTAGFRAKKYLGNQVIVNWWAESGRKLATEVADDRVRQREMLASYAEAVKAAGWSVEVNRSIGYLTVYSNTRADVPQG